MGTISAARRVKKYRSASAGFLALCGVALAASGWAATMPIYKCLDKNLTLVYTDEPCKDGERLDIRSGEADAAAVARLERQRDALDQSAHQRAVDQRHMAIADAAASRSGYDPGDEAQWYDDGSACVADYGIISYAPMHRDPMRHRKSKAQAVRHIAPRPPSTALRD
jgi:hypothetical protein